MLKLCHVLAKTTKNCNRVLPTLTKVKALSSASTLAEAKSMPGSNSNGESDNETKTVGKQKSSVKKHPSRDMVAAAFASLKSESPEDNSIKTPFTDEKITNAKTVNELLSISIGNGVSRQHAFKVVSVLADWSSSGKVSLAEFESDPRFIRLCRVLTKTHPQKNKNSVSSRSEDLSTILSVTADDEAAKLVGSITISQMVKVMSTLCQKKRRSTLLLRALSYNITASPEKLDLKQCADVLYSISVLNFTDDNLLVRLSNDICNGLKTFKCEPQRSSVIGSIITSLGLLRYKNTELLDGLSEWILANHNQCRPQDVFSLFMTLAVLNHAPSNSGVLYKKLLPELTQAEAGKPLVWLEIVWSLVLLNQASHEHVSSVLCDSFVNKLGESRALSPSTKLKIKNIDAAATYLLEDYQGSRITDTTNINNIQMARSKEKSEMTSVLIDSLRSLIQSEKYLATGVNSGAGFYIDATFILDRKCNPLPLDTQTTETDSVKVAVLAHDYHDMCRGKVEPTGINVFAAKILEKLGYKVLIVPYTEFNIRDKVIHRVQYLESKLKEVIQ